MPTPRQTWQPAEAGGGPSPGREGESGQGTRQSPDHGPPAFSTPALAGTQAFPLLLAGGQPQDASSKPISASLCVPLSPLFLPHSPVPGTDLSAGDTRWKLRVHLRTRPPSCLCCRPSIPPVLPSPSSPVLCPLALCCLSPLPTFSLAYFPHPLLPSVSLPCYCFICTSICSLGRGWAVVGRGLCPLGALGPLVSPPPLSPERCLAHSKHSIKVCLIELGPLWFCRQLFLSPWLLPPPSLSLTSQ